MELLSSSDDAYRAVNKKIPPTPKMGTPLPNNAKRRAAVDVVSTSSKKRLRPGRMVSVMDWRRTASDPSTIEFKIKWERFSSGLWEPESDLVGNAWVEDFRRSHPEIASSGDTNAQTHTAVSSEQAVQDDRHSDQDSNPVVPVIGSSADDVPAEDDPQVDWRDLKSDEAEDSTYSDTDSQDNYNMRGSQKASTMLGHGDYKDCRAPPIDWATINVGDVYRRFLKNLCRQTASAENESTTVLGIQYAATLLRNQNLREEIQSSSPSSHAYALVITTWLAICRDVQMGEEPSDLSTTTLCGAAFLTAHDILQETFDIDTEILADTVRFLEGRLLAMNARKREWIRAPWWRSVKRQIDPISKPPSTLGLDSVATAYSDALEYGEVDGLANELLNRQDFGPETPLRLLIKEPGQFNSHKVEIIKMLASTDKDLLRACIQRRVPALSERRCEPVANALKDNLQGDRRRPVIYLNELCDRAGSSPTTIQWKRVLLLTQLYITPGQGSDELAARVDQLSSWRSDNWPRRLARLGLRRYTELRSYQEYGSEEPCKSRRDIVQHFIDRMTERVVQAESAGKSHIPFDAAVIEIGYTINPSRRLREHRSHSHSNYLMNLSEALFEHVYPNYFPIKQVILFSCWLRTHPWLGEIIFTQLCQGYTVNAGGFSHYPAGRSNGSAYKSTVSKEWATLEQRMIVNDRLIKRLGEIRAFIDKRRLEPPPPASPTKDEKAIARLTSQVARMAMNIMR